MTHRTIITRESYADNLKDPRWQQCRLRVLEAADWQCIACSSRTKTLHVHHLYYRDKQDPWDYPRSDLLPLCETCHDRVHSYIKRPSCPKHGFQTTIILNHIKYGVDSQMTSELMETSERALPERDHGDPVVLMRTNGAVFSVDSNRTLVDPEAACVMDASVVPRHAVVHFPDDARRMLVLG